MLPRLDAAAAPGDGRGYEGAAASDVKDDLGLPSFRSLFDEDYWYLAPAADDHQPFGENKALSFHSDSPPPPPEAVLFVDALAPTYPPTTAIASFLDALCSNPFDAEFDLGDEASNSSVLLGRGPDGGVLGLGGFGGGEQMTSPSSSLLLLPGDGSDLSSGCFNPTGGFHSFENSPCSKIVRLLETFPPVGAQPALLPKRAAMSGDKGASLVLPGSEQEKRRRVCEEDDTEEPSIDGSAWNYDSEEEGMENSKGDDDLKNADATTIGGRDQKGKGKGLPAKNLMAERRRRKKLNDRLYMLRSIVPKISKMDRTSILGDAIEYLKELLQRINDLHNELESTPSSSSLPTTAITTTSFHPMTPTPTLPCRAKEEPGPRSLQIPTSQPPRVEVRVREGRSVNIHMFCARKSGLLLSTMRALDSLGLDIQQAVISCFNGFALDVFQAEQCDEGPGVMPEEIKTVLLHSAGY